MRTGGCRCGAVRYTVATDRAPIIYACHCTICQRATGSSFALQASVAEAALFVEGELTLASVAGPSGAIGTSRHCSRCLSRVYNTNDRRPGLAVVRAGTLDRGERLQPVLHIYTETKQPWITVPDDVPQFPDNAPMNRWAALLAGHL